MMFLTESQKELIDSYSNYLMQQFKDRYPKNYMGEPELNGNVSYFSLNDVTRILSDIQMDLRSFIMTNHCVDGGCRMRPGSFFCEACNWQQVAQAEASK